MDSSSNASFTTDGENYSVDNLSLEIESDSEMEDTTRNGISQTEFEGSFEIELDTEETVCPHCNEVNHLPEGEWLAIFTEDPFPCVFCGYPLK